MALQHRFQAGMDHGTWWLSSRVDGRDAGRRELGREHVWLAPKMGVLGALHGAVARALRFFGYALLASPLLVPLYLVARLVSPLLAGWLVVLFVVAVVGFFAVLNAFIVFALIRYALTSTLTLRLWALGSDEPPRDRLFSPSRAPTTVRGEVIRIGAPADGDVVLRDLVSRAKSVRIFEACDFAVYTDSGEYVVVRIEDAPLLLSRREPRSQLALPEPTRAGLAERGIARPERERSLHTYCVRVGDRVSVTGFEEDTLPRADRFELGGELRGVTTGHAGSAPYRGARSDSAVLMRCSAGSPMLVVREGGP
ncbi:MAG: hypothetical protein KC593_12425 [Myxococcales bacterium]|nr:hypothetical protein [Myxococcales bacterium]MCB9628827.1 hypothetical protein [Sandaracinaceae bacterium]